MRKRKYDRAKALSDRLNAACAQVVMGAARQRVSGEPIAEFVERGGVQPAAASETV